HQLRAVERRVDHDDWRGRAHLNIDRTDVRLGAVHGLEGHFYGVRSQAQIGFLVIGDGGAVDPPVEFAWYLQAGHRAVNRIGAAGQQRDARGAVREGERLSV